MLDSILKLKSTRISSWNKSQHNKMSISSLNRWTTCVCGMCIGENLVIWHRGDDMIYIMGDYRQKKGLFFVFTVPLTSYTNTVLVSWIFPCKLLITSTYTPYVYITSINKHILYHFTMFKSIFFNTLFIKTWESSFVFYPLKRHRLSLGLYSCLFHSSKTLLTLLRVYWSKSLEPSVTPTHTAMVIISYDSSFSTDRCSNSPRLISVPPWYFTVDNVFDRIAA